MRRVSLFALVATLAVLALLLAPGIAGAHGDESDIQIGDTYLVWGHNGLELWKETNGDPGLQRDWHCHPSGGPLPCARGETAIPPDSPGIKI